MRGLRPVRGLEWLNHGGHFKIVPFPLAIRVILRDMRMRIGATSRLFDHFYDRFRRIITIQNCDFGCHFVIISSSRF